MRVAAPLEREVNDPVLGVTLQAPQYDPVFEGLAEDDQLFQFVPSLATSWSMAPDGKTWTFNLGKGVPWHFGWGEFTATDVIHSMERFTRPESTSSKVGIMTNFLEDYSVVDDYQIEFRLAEPYLDAPILFSKRSVFGVLSKAYFDAEGQEGVNRKMVGTGPYQFVERVSGSYILHERVPYEHWRISPDFDEIQIFFVKEPSTRLAMLLANEVDLSVLPFGLQQPALDAGLEVVQTTIPTTVVYTEFGGNYKPTSEYYDPNIVLPWAAPGEVGRLVREALNRAVNREELQNTILGGRGDPMVVTFWLPSLPGWNPEWAATFEEKYGYDPERAKELLKEAEELNGGPLDWSDSYLLITPRQELSELEDIGEAIHGYWREVGVDLRLEQKEFAFFREAFLAGKIHGIAWTDATPFRETDQEMIRVIYASKSQGGPVNFFESEFIDQKYQELISTVNLDTRDRILREVGQNLFDEYATLPMFTISSEFVVNPAVVAEYRTSGILPPRHLEYIKAARK